MLRFALARIGLAVPTFIGLTLIAFFLIRIFPGTHLDQANSKFVCHEKYRNTRTEKD